MKKLTALITGIGLLFTLHSPVFADLNIQADPRIVKITDAGKLIGASVAVLMIVAVLAALFFLVLGGLQWITSGGDKAGVEGAQHKIQAALIGLVIVFAVFAIFQLVGQFLGFNVLSLPIPTPF